MFPVSLIRDLSLSLQSQWGYKAIVVWCNGSTTGFGSVCPGSNPGTTAFLAFFLQVGTNLNVNGTFRVYNAGNVPYLCSVSFHAHIWLVIDFRDVLILV